MSPEGKPIQVNASALQAASAQNTMGMLKMKIDKTANFQELSINWEGKFLLIKSQRWHKATFDLWCRFNEISHRHAIPGVQISKFWRLLV